MSRSRDRRPRRTSPLLPRRPIGLVVVALVALTLTACGDASGGTTATGANGPGPSSGPPLPSLLIQASDLPPDFRPSTGESAGYRFTLCGVDLEPTPATEQASARFATNEVGPFVEQRVRRYPDDSQAHVIDAMTAALRTCTTTTATDPSAPGRDTTFTVSPLDLPRFADQSVAWHQVAASSPQVPTDVVLMRQGRTIVLVTSYTFGRATDPDAVLAAARAAADRLTASGAPGGPETTP